MKSRIRIAGATLVAAAGLIGAVAAPASASQASPPFSASCQRPGYNFDPHAEPLADFCITGAPGFSSKEVTRLFRACEQAGGTPFRIISVGADAVECSYV
jgi:hypothetical protein